MATRSASTPVGAQRPKPLFTALVGDDTTARLCELANGTVITPGMLVPYIGVAEMETVLFDGPFTVIAASTARTLHRSVTPGHRGPRPALPTPVRVRRPGRAVRCGSHRPRPPRREDDPVQRPARMPTPQPRRHPPRPRRHPTPRTTGHRPRRDPRPSPLATPPRPQQRRRRRPTPPPDPLDARSRRIDTPRSLPRRGTLVAGSRVAVPRRRLHRRESPAASTPGRRRPSRETFGATPWTVDVIDRRGRPPTTIAPLGDDRRPRPALHGHCGLRPRATGGGGIDPSASAGSLGTRSLNRSRPSRSLTRNIDENECAASTQRDVRPRSDAAWSRRSAADARVESASIAM